MDPQHLDRLDDEGTVRPTGTGTEGGPVATPSSDRTGVPAPVLSLCRAVRRRHAGRPVLVVAAAIIGVAGLGLTAAGAPSPVARAAGEESVSVAEELGMIAEEQPALTGEEAAARLQELAATRAQREDAEAAAAQVQAEADRVASEAAAAAAAAAAEAARPKAVLPVQGRLTSQFGSRWGTLHAGIDFAAPLGTPEYAVMDGVVLRAGAASGFGLAVYIQHADGDVSVYGHMREILVEEGQTVRAGDTIALLGNEGQSTGPHLHFEVHDGALDGPRIDPLPWLRERGVAI
ncbi:M23 family metallopeptidase [Modestobacter sp. VKM Ac-2984]|uniref:M23 family metallopeptidase n=1 Tax=Modestobacter sp. VKM Ac-2984 TaxID=3004138 RepID=UPI0022AA0F6C|nr:M23 family metallopeptidase [Modestobacter sp. VKM Ac-2984]MCZ2815175.1 M23 family metallopeptidase [Modestobacter sp. VKM Ac-2984]